MCRAKATAVCQVPGCQADLAAEAVGKHYCVRHHICRAHLQAQEISCPGSSQPLRYCMQCGKLEQLSAFDGHKRSCRAKLCERKNRRSDKGKTDCNAPSCELICPSAYPLSGTVLSLPAAWAWGLQCSTQLQQQQQQGALQTCCASPACWVHHMAPPSAPLQQAPALPPLTGSPAGSPACGGSSALAQRNAALWAAHGQPVPPEDKEFEDMLFKMLQEELEAAAVPPKGYPCSTSSQTQHREIMSSSYRAAACCSGGSTRRPSESALTPALEAQLPLSVPVSPEGLRSSAGALLHTPAAHLSQELAQAVSDLYYGPTALAAAPKAPGAWHNSIAPPAEAAAAVNLAAGCMPAVGGVMVANQPGPTAQVVFGKERLAVLESHLMQALQAAENLERSMQLLGQQHYDSPPDCNSCA